MASQQQKTKKQHTVPQCYLKSWLIPGKESMHVYDRKRNHFRVNNITDVASHRYFYDTEPINLLPEETLLTMLEGKIALRPDADPQIIEHTFSDVIEDAFEPHLNSIIRYARRIPVGQVSSGTFYQAKQKEELSELLALQLIRTKQYRVNIEESSQCIAQILKDMGIPDEEITRVTLSPEGAKRAQLRNILDIQDLERIAISFYSLTWILCINRTRKKFYTSDNPIAQIEHKHDLLFPNNGLRSPGVEVIFPIAPDLLLIMHDGQYHQVTHKDLTCWECFTENTINYYNEIITLNSETCTISQNGDWHVIGKMLKHKPDVFKQPKTQIEWGGKTYIPAKDSKQP